MIEVLKDVAGYEGYYQVSNYGYVKSIERIDCRNKPVPACILTIFDNGKGYKHVFLFKDGMRAMRRLHRLVAQHFNDNPDNLPEVNHIDYNKANNRSDNLEWKTRLGNMRHAVENNLTQHGPTFFKRVLNTKTNQQFNSVTSAANNYNISFKKMRNKIKKEKDFILINN